MTQTEKQKMMLTAPVEGLICRMAVPTIISMLITALYNMADTYFVGKLGSNAATGAGEIAVPAAEGRRFYRLRERPAP